MKRKTLKFLAAMAVAAVTFAASAIPASAQPITLFTDQITKLKFVNFENFFDVNNNQTIDSGDYFQGILNIEAITNISGSQDLSAQLGSKELTGDFQISVVGGLLPLGGAGHVDFGMAAGDYLNLYVGTGATKNWNPASGTNGVAEATDGSLWASITGGTGFGYEGINDTTIFPVAASVNRNWADLDINNTGYPILKELYSSTAGEPPLHFIDVNNNGVYDAGTDTLHGDHLVDVYFASRLFANIDPKIPNWQFRSEDPVYVHATPEPGTILLLGMGLLGTGFVARRRFKK